MCAGEERSRAASKSNVREAEVCKREESVRAVERSGRRCRSGRVNGQLSVELA